MSSCIAVIADSGGSSCQPSLTRAKPSLASMATPKRRRKRFTRCSTSSPGPQRESRRDEDDQDGAYPALGALANRRIRCGS